MKIQATIHEESGDIVATIETRTVSGQLRLDSSVFGGDLKNGDTLEIDIPTKLERLHQGRPPS